MLKRHELEDPNSCLNKAKDDEFIFVLLERDLTIEEVIAFWISKRIEMRLNGPGSDKLMSAQREIGFIASRRKQEDYPRKVELSSCNFSQEEYDKAIENLRLGKQQQDADPCSVCGDSGHQAHTCGFNPIVAMKICRQMYKAACEMHELLHWLAGFDFHMGEQLGPAKVIPPADEMEATADFEKRNNPKQETT